MYNTYDVCEKPVECIPKYIPKYKKEKPSIDLAINPPCVGVPCKKQEEKKENTMDYNMEVDQRNHMKRRLEALVGEKRKPLREKFHMNEVELNTKDEITAALKAGNFELVDAFFQNGKLAPYYNPQNTIRFVDAAKDDAGYAAADALLAAAYTKAKDAIIVLPLAEGLAALQAFEKDA